MKYYKVKEEFDQTQRKDGSILIQNELYTKREKELYNISDKMLNVVNINKNNTFFSFGARFEGSL